MGDVWYPYDAPIYPYPLDVADIVVPDGTVIDPGPGVIADAPVDPSGVAYEPGPVAVSVVSPAGGVALIVRPLPPGPIVNYRCATPVGLYPDVHLCPSIWTIAP